MRDRVAVELLDLVVRESPHVVRAFAGRGIEEAMRAARIAAGLPVAPLAIEEITVPSRTGDPRVEPDEATRQPRTRRSSAPVLAAQGTAAQHFTAARAELDAGLEHLGEAAKRAVAIDDEKEGPA